MAIYAQMGDPDSQAEIEKMAALWIEMGNDVEAWDCCHHFIRDAIRKLIRAKQQEEDKK